MEIEFDPAKDAANRLIHGLSLADAGLLDLEDAAVIRDDRTDYGELRFRAFGRIAGVGHCLVFTIRGETMRPISFRRARDKEMKRYDR